MDLLVQCLCRFAVVTADECLHGEYITYTCPPRAKSKSIASLPEERRLMGGLVGVVVPTNGRRVRGDVKG
jgi:hypothetical protein